MATSKEQSFRLPILGESEVGLDIDIEAELRRFEAEESARLGLTSEKQHWVDKMVDPQFMASQVQTTTLLVSGLTQAHDFLVQAALEGIGYKVEVIDCPDNDALRYGKEFGNRGQCNPTYFTVGNLVKFLTERGRREGLTARQMVDKYVFLTAGACGPCRFGMYSTEYRKALRDAGFDGFRVMLFQQKGGLKQATGEEVGLKMNPAFFLGLIKAIISGDVINGMGYRLRPFEVEPGATDRAIAKAKNLVRDALVKRTSVLAALVRARKELGTVKCDFTRPAPRVSIIGEFWAMTTEGDGNYQLQRFLESEGAECDIQFVTNWLLFMLWEGRYDTKLRAELRGVDEARKSLKNVRVGRKLATLFFGDLVVRAAFQLFGACIGFRGYHLPDMDEVAAAAHRYYNNNVRGGEGHMEVGKFILNVLHKKNHMTLSVKPFGCMPSSGVSDGVQSLITGLYPESIFCAIETSGDGKVNVHSRVQMYLFKARQAAQAEYAAALEKLGTTVEAVREFLDANPHFASPLHRAPFAAAGTAADRLHEIAPYLGKSPWQVRALRVKALATKAAKTTLATPGTLAGLRRKLVEKAPVLMERAREEWQEWQVSRAGRPPIELRDVVGKAAEVTASVRARVTRRKGSSNASTSASAGAGAAAAAAV